MALNVQMIKYYNQMIGEEIVVPRLVNLQSMDFYQLCEYLADGSTVTPGDVAAVMKLIEVRLPLILGLSTKVVCSPEGLTFRPAVSGSITQSQLKRKLEARLLEDPEAEIDVDRALTGSDLSVNDLTASIAIDLPKKWKERFQIKAEFKRVTKVTADAADDISGSAGGGTDDSGSTVAPPPVGGGD